MPSQYETNYAKLVNEILTSGAYRDDTRNHPTYSLFGKQLVIDELKHGRFPILTGRKMFYKSVLGEFAAFLRGPKHLKDFEKFGCKYWKQWADKDGNINVDYGNSWFDFEGHNQVLEVIKQLRGNPGSRRMLISGWRPHKIAELSLPCCHLLYQWRVNPKDNTLDMLFFLRSVDVMVGLPSDVILAAIWNLLMAQTTGYKPGTITMMFGDAHIYKSHINNACKYYELAKTAPMAPEYILSLLSSFVNFIPDHLALRGYQPLDKLNFEVHA